MRFKSENIIDVAFLVYAASILFTGNNFYDYNNYFLTELIALLWIGNYYLRYRKRESKDVFRMLMLCALAGFQLANVIDGFLVSLTYFHNSDLPKEQINEIIDASYPAYNCWCKGFGFITGLFLFITALCDKNKGKEWRPDWIISILEFFTGSRNC